MLEPMTGRAKWIPAARAARRVPWIVGSRRHTLPHRRCRHPTQAPMLPHRPRIPSRTSGAGGVQRARPLGRGPGTGIATTPVRGACGTSSASTRGDPVGALGERASKIRGQLGGELAQLLRGRSDSLQHLGAKAQRVLRAWNPSNTAGGISPRAAA